MLAIATDTVDADQLKKPKKLDIKMIRSFMTFFGFLSTVFDMTLILMLIFAFHATPQLFRTAWFFESALSEIIITFSIRTKQPFFKSRPGTFLTLISAVIIGILVLLVYTPLGNLFEFTDLNAPIIFLIFGIVGVYFVSSELVKKYFFRKFEF